LDGQFILGGFEILHGKQVLFSKKTSGLWPNASAVAQRVQLYFNDLENGRDVSYYGTQKEKAYTPKKKPRLGSAYSTGMGELSGFNPKHAQTSEGFNGSPSKPNNDLQSSPETGYKDPEEKNDEVEHKEEKPEETQNHHEEKTENVANEHGEHEAPGSPVKQEGQTEDQPISKTILAGLASAILGEEPKSATTENAQDVQKPAENQPEHHPEDAQPKTENKEESAGLPQEKVDAHPEPHQNEAAAENTQKPVAEENKEGAAVPHENKEGEAVSHENEEKVKAQKNPTEDEYPEDFGN